MVKLYDGGVYLVNGTEIVTDPAALPMACGRAVTKEEAEKPAELRFDRRPARDKA